MAKWRNTTQKPPLGARIDWGNQITKDLVGCWLFNEYGGKVVGDLSRSFGDGQLEGTYYWKEGIKFSGGRVVLADTPLSKISIVAKIRNGGSGNNEQILTRDKSVSSDYHRVWQFRKNSSDKLEFIHFYSNTSYDVFTGSIDIADGTDKMVAVTADGSTAKLFVNGEVDTSGTLSGTLNSISYRALIADSDNNSEEFFYGDIYFAYLFSRALSDDEIGLLHYEPYSFFEIPSLYIPVSWQSQPSQQTGKHRIVTSSKWKQTTQKPPLGARIDWSNPITQGLVNCFLLNEYASLPFDLVDNNSTEVITGSVSWKGDSFNLVSGGLQKKKLNYQDYSGDCTVIAVVNQRLDEDANCYWVVAEEGESLSTNVLQSFRRYSGNLRTFWEYGSGSNVILDYTSLSIPTNQDTFIGISRDTSLKTQVAFVNDDKETLSYSTNPEGGSSAKFLLGVDSANSYSNIARYWLKYLYIFSRALTDDEIKLLHYEPYSFFEVPSMRTVVALGGITVTPNDATHSQTADNVALTRTTQLAVDDATHQHTADSVSLTRTTSLTVNSATHSQTAESSTLARITSLAVNETTHTQTADNVSFPAEVYKWEFKLDLMTGNLALVKVKQ